MINAPMIVESSFIYIRDSGKNQPSCGIRYKATNHISPRLASKKKIGYQSPLQSSSSHAIKKSGLPDFVLPNAMKPMTRKKSQVNIMKINITK